jgi:DNA repair protein RadC
MFLGINHPSDDFYPIERDYLITRKIADAIEPIGIYLTDTMICKGEKIFSFRQNGSFSFREMR